MSDVTHTYEFGDLAIQALLDAGLDSCEAACLICDPNANRIYHFSQAMTELTGLEKSQLSRSKVSDLFPGQLPDLLEMTQACLEQGSTWTVQLSVKQKKADPKPVEIFASKFHVKSLELIFLLIFDLRQLKGRRYESEFDELIRTDHAQSKHLESIFRNLESGNRLILDAAGEGIYGVDAEGKTSFLNPAAERMLGWRAEELVGRVMHTAIHHSHEDGTPYSLKCCPIYAAFQDGDVHRVDDEVFWRKDGSSFAVEYTSTPILNGGKSIGAVTVFRDISERRKTEQSLKVALEQVEQLKERLELENAHLQAELSEDSKHGEIVGISSVVKRILRQVDLVAPTDANVFITGESGTGKELIARAIHRSSARKARPLVRVNCAAIPRELFESELFGHKKGAFTGAISERLGKLELADGGTLFLDDVGALPLEHQAKLLRVLQEQEFERLGEGKLRQVDIRIIAASNENLENKVEAKTFREDLFFRLSVFPISSPPLRERLDDIPHLATHFIEQSCNRLNIPNRSVSLGEVERLKAYGWPGNIIELENVIERAVIVSGGSKLRFDLPDAANVQVTGKKESKKQDNFVQTEDELVAIEKANILSALKLTNGRVSGNGGAAEVLGIKPTTLYSRLKRYGIDARKFKT